MSSSSQEYIGKSSLIPFRSIEWAPKCPCGHGFMILKSSRTTSNPGRKFWKCPDLHGGKGCGLLIWMDEIAPECIPMQTLNRSQVKVKLEEMKDSINELCLEIRRLSESMETNMKGSRSKKGLTFTIAILLLFVAYMWRGQNDRRAYLSYGM